MLYLGSALKGYTVEAPDGKVGTVSDFLFDASTWKVRWMVIDTGDWLTERKILLPPPALGQPDINGRAMPVSLTKAQVAASPTIDHDQPVSRQMEYRLGGYYGSDPRWEGIGYGYQPTMAPAPVAAGADHPAVPDPNLRSMSEVLTYDIHALDGTIGHLENLQINSETWLIEYLVIDTANWWFGKHVVLPPTTITEINWAGRFVKIDLTAYKIKGSPPWEGTSVVDRAYEGLLRLHYGWPAVPTPAEPAAKTPAKV